ncbi:uncharacterized protein CIMG_06758 [Coccidioides immitis RS]|uniref:Uncharacterized protein n=2 Tax=Coccidioides immitis TaxID=5501 RepID=A0A0E1RW71_COCIM|nr:uncharacterized protein CIMG_06758 [Coccidioides immitis RS]EAS31279.1 hypothetical protein CIMG_06758 [Coccidioides immitis RS]KMP03903.1 hypothetical protein CIRG_03595 [Coccidioides immitis RMSCC 2394]
MDYPRQFELSMKEQTPSRDGTDRGACGGGSDTSVGQTAPQLHSSKVLQQTKSLSRLSCCELLASLPRLPDRVVPQRPAYIVMSCQVQYLPQQFAQPSMRGAESAKFTLNVR